MMNAEHDYPPKFPLNQAKNEAHRSIETGRSVRKILRTMRDQRRHWRPDTRASINTYPPIVQLLRASCDVCDCLGANT